MEEEFQQWRKRGSVGKLRNFEVFVKRSPQRQQVFRFIQLEHFHLPHSILLSSPNATRWNSVFLMINDALNLREIIERYFREMLSKNSPLEAKDRDRLKLCQLSNDEWDELIELHALLYPFWELTMQMQGNIAESLLSEDSNSRSYKSEKVYNQNGKTLLHRPIETRERDEDSALFNVLPAFDNLLSRLEASKDQEDLSQHLCICTNLAWIKMTEYYQKTDVVKVYLVAAVLDPRLKMKYFEDNWKKEWRRNWRAKLDSYMEEFTIAMGETNASSPPSPKPDNDEMFDSQTTDNSWGSWYAQAAADDTPVVDEWSRYLKTGRVKNYRGFSVRRWWLDHENDFPMLSRMALELLAIPAMSTEVERVFSGYVLNLLN